MQDLQGFQYYDPSPLPTPEPWWKRRRTWITAGAVAAIVVVVMFAVVGVINALKNRPLNATKATLAEMAATEMQLSSNCEANDQACLDRARADAARSVGSAQGCEQLTGELLENCVSLIARDQKDPQACNLLESDAKQACENATWLLKAKEQNSLEACNQITDASTRGVCQTQVKDSLISQGRCADAQVDQSLCDNQSVLNDAVATGDATRCEALSDETDQFACLYLISSTDNDQDGLMLADEVTQGLSDAIADGDGDGLNDGDEVHVYTTNPAISDTDGDPLN
jgi:hypothetical protein